MNNLTEKEKQAINELVHRLKKLYGNNLSRVVLYGSKARGDARPDSDIDILVVLKNIPDKVEEFDKIVKLSNEIDFEYEILTSVVIKDEQEYLTCESPLMLNLRREGIEI